MKTIHYLFVTVALLLVSDAAQAQFGQRLGNAVQKAAENTTVKKAEQKTSQTVSKGIDKATDPNTYKSDEKDANAGANQQQQANTSSNAGNANTSPASPASSTSPVSSTSTPQQDIPKLESYSEYDFVPGDQILFYEDFSQDAIGDFPALWTSNKSGEVKTLNNFPGKWFQLTTGGMIVYLNKIDFPQNFILEFDYIPLISKNSSYAEGGIRLYHDKEGSERELDTGLFPGQTGFVLFFQKGGLGWRLKAHDYRRSGNDRNGTDYNSPINRIKTEQVNHVIVWVQGRRVRVYHEGAKVLDAPTALFPDAKFSRLLLMSNDADNKPFYSNIKITTAAPDVRSKLITEGKLISYGINFDSGRDVIKPTSYGAVKSIADVLKENPDVRVRVIGHTDTDGNADANLDLSKRRAAAVKACLEKEFGIDSSRIETDGKGQTEPLAPNNTVEGKAKNRRVEFVKI
jgi:outer membrane protein OmpA-like peptidoglycan-associated protein